MTGWTREELSQAFAFVGNTLLGPMNQTDTIGLDSAFWEWFGRFGESAAAAAQRCAAYVHAREGLDEAALVREVSVEYTRLFIGPPRPVSAPWETFYRGSGVKVGFGAATFEMQALLRAAGLEISNDNNQYADHMGIELLYLSILLEEGADDCASFVEDHPGSWVGDFAERVCTAQPDGYYRGIVELAASLLALIG